MKHVLIKNRDGSVQVMHLIAQLDGSYPDPKTEIAKWSPSKQAEVASWREIDADGIPQNRGFRGAWCDVTPEPAINIDMPKAREIHRGRLREMREPKLAALDVEITRAFKDPEKQNAIETQRKALRDVTEHPSIDAAKTPEELLEAIPDILK